MEFSKMYFKFRANCKWSPTFRQILMRHRIFCNRLTKQKTIEFFFSRCIIERPVFPTLGQNLRMPNQPEFTLKTFCHLECRLHKIICFAFSWTIITFYLSLYVLSFVDYFLHKARSYYWMRYLWFSLFHFTVTVVI